MASRSVALVAFALALHFANLGGGTLDAWDEGLSGERAREMLAAGSWMTPLLDGAPDWNKPPLYYWMVIAGYRSLGVNELAVRLPSALFGLTCLALVYAIARQLTASRAGGLLAAALLLANPHWMATTREGLLDSGFTAAMLAGGWVLCTPSPSARRALAGGALIGLGAALKNPVAVLAFAMPLAAWRLDAPRMQWRALAIALLAFLVVGSWWYAFEAWRYGRPFLDFYVGYNLWERATTGIEGHRTALWLYAQQWLVETPVTLLAFVVPLAWAAQSDRTTLRRVAPLLAFVAVWLLAIHAAVSKRPIYLAPVYPFVAAASAPLAIALWRRIGSPRAVAVAFGIAALAFLAFRYDASLDFSPDVAAAARDVAARAAPDDAVGALEKPRHLVSFYARRRVQRVDAAWVPDARASWVVAPRREAEPLRDRLLAREPTRSVSIACVSAKACAVAIARRAVP